MLKQIILDYVESIDALRDFVDSIKLLLEEHRNSVITTEEPEVAKRFEKLQGVLGSMPKEKRDALLRKPPKEIESDKEQKESLGFEYTFQMRRDKAGHKFGQFEVPINVLEVSESSQQTFFRIEKQKALLYKNSLVTLTSTVELFLSQLLHFYFDRFPEAVGAHEKFFSLDDLKALGSIEDAKQHLIESEGEDVLRGSLEDWIRFLKERVNLSMGYLNAAKDNLIEVYQRRNLLIHNGGRVNSIYLSKVKRHLTESLARDEVLDVPPEYLSAAIELFELNFMLIGAELWKKLNPIDEERPTTLINIAFSHLLKERWRIAEGLSYFVMSDKQISERSQMIGQLNYWQSVKWQGRFEDIRKEVEQADFSARDSLYQLGQLALLNKNEAFFSLLPDVLRSGKLTIEDLRAWPVFREMREDPAYNLFIPKPPPDGETHVEEREGSIH